MIDSNRPCLCCQKTGRIFLADKNSFRIQLCSYCRSLYAAADKEKIIQQNYDEYYSEANLSVPTFIIERCAEIVSKFASYKQLNRMLDVGCGAGSLLSAAVKLEWAAEGLEVSAPAVEFLRKQGFVVRQGYLENQNYPDNYFDVVTASEILEHVENPLEFLTEIKRILRPGGLFWGTTPNSRGISGIILGSQWSCVSPPEHIQLFSVRGVHILLEKVGFKTITVLTHGTNPGEIFYGLKQKVASSKVESSNQAGFDRVQTSYRLNESLMQSRWRKTLKDQLNNLLNLTKTGDSLKIWAVK
jgi:2-polyprenyl-3-methyl-5-hydroxy-6-metoxy-1,4-benzoquinol methylase